MTDQTCKCKTVQDTLHDALHKKPVAACAEHGTFGYQPDAAGEPLALNSTALEDTLRAALDKTTDDHLHGTQPNI